MADTGWLDPGDVDQEILSGDSWADELEIRTSDNVFATANVDPSGLTDKIIPTTFSPTVIDDADTLNGVEFKVEISLASGSSQFNIYAQLYYGGVGIGSEKSFMGQSLSTTETTLTFGGAADMWSSSLTPEEAKSIGAFGVAVYVEEALGGDAYTVQIDHTPLKIYYTAAGGGTVIPVLMNQYRQRR